jgi:hypothetical protein
MPVQSDSLDPDMDGYRAHVASLASGAKDGLCLDLCFDQAAVATEYLFYVASNRIDILTESLESRIYGVDAVIGGAVAFLERTNTTQLRVLAERTLDRDQHPLLIALRAAGLDHKVLLYQVPSPLRSTYAFQFMLVDSKHFRLQESRTSSESYTQFRNEILGRQMSRVFADLKLLSKPHILSTDIGSGSGAVALA